jgi:pectinesterase
MYKPAAVLLAAYVACFGRPIHAEDAQRENTSPPAVTAAVVASNNLPPDITVAADGSGDFKTVQEAVASIPRDNHERLIILIKPGVYKEKVRVNADNITLRGENRQTTRLEYPQLMDDFTKQPDDIGRAVVNVHGDDFVLENLTVNNTAGVIGKHAFAVYGDADRTVIVDSDVLSQGNDTVSLWDGKKGRYYHARCNFRGSVDFVCPRGWCYVTDCNFFEVKPTAAVWHDGHVNQDMEFVLRDCKFDGVPGWCLARHHVDAQFYFIDCTFSQTMADKPPRRVIYPLGSAAATEADKQRNATLDKQNLWGERAYYFNCHRSGGEYDWFRDNFVQAPGSPKADQITAAWTFADTWNPESTAGPTIEKITPHEKQLAVKFNENVTVKGHPRLAMLGGAFADYASGSGSDTLIFTLPVNNAQNPAAVTAVDLQGGAIIASQAGAALRFANLSLPSAP